MICSHQVEKILTDVKLDKESQNDLQITPESTVLLLKYDQDDLKLLLLPSINSAE